MSLKSWVIGKIIDTEKHAELDERERRTDQRVDELRAERQRNGFGQIFTFEGFAPPRKPQHREGH